MSETPNKSERKNFFIALAVISFAAVVFALIYDFSIGAFSQGGDTGKLLGHLSGGFFLPGLLFLCFGGLIFAKRQGTFDGLSYGLRYTFNIFTPMFWLNKEERSGKFQKFADYKETKREKEKSKINLSVPFLIVGAVFFLVGIVLAVITEVSFPGTTLK